MSNGIMGCHKHALSWKRKTKSKHASVGHFILPLSHLKPPPLHHHHHSHQVAVQAAVVEVESCPADAAMISVQVCRAAG